MPTDEITHAVARYRACLTNVLEPATWTPVETTVRLEAASCDTPIPVDQTNTLDWSEVALGHRWGPAWSTCWFRISAPPVGPQHGLLHLRFDAEGESLLYRDGVPYHGIDQNRAFVPLWHGDTDAIDLLIESACNHPFGAAGLQWDDAREHRRWKSPTPAELIAAELVTVDRELVDVVRRYAFVTELLATLSPDGPRARELHAVLRHATSSIRDSDVRETTLPLRQLLDRAITRPAAGSATTCHAVGHAHIDHAWLWPIRETRRKCARTFATVLRNMERFDRFRFMCSHAAQYAMIEQDHPALFEQIRERVEQRRWEPTGAMWVEPDCNLISAESMIRQIQHGTGYWRDRFGDAAPQRLLYLPDTFGFPAALPQIMRLAGLDTFVTNKLSWNDTNEMPHTTFLWRGIDGSEVLAHLTPGADYNATNTPAELRRGEANHRSIGTTTDLLTDAADGNARWLQPFGYGDGGGGPTAWSIDYAELAADCDGLPRVRLDTSGAFCDALHSDLASRNDAGLTTPVWDGDLYLELHRGTFTTQAWLKEQNRQLEAALKRAELMLAAAPTVPPEFDELVTRIDACWKELLTLQFHDILPGSSIEWVYADAAESVATVRTTLRAVFDQLAPHWAEAVGTNADRLAFNQTWFDQQLADGERIPALGCAALTASPVEEPAPESEATQDETIELTFEDRAVARIGRDGVCRTLVIDGVDLGPCGDLGRLELFEDRPRLWDAWDIDAEATDQPIPLRTTGVWRHAGGDDVTIGLAINDRCTLELTYRWRMLAGEPWLEATARISDVEQLDAHRLLRASFAVDRADRAFFDIAGACAARPTHRNTSWERARFEVPAHAWATCGRLAVLNDGRYGHSCQDGTLSLSLWRTPTYPDERSDRRRLNGLESDVIRYALGRADPAAPSAPVERAARALNEPIQTSDGQPIDPSATTRVGSAWSPVAFEVHEDDAIELLAIQPVSPDRFTLRIAEKLGRATTIRLRWTIPARGAERVDLLGHPLADASPVVVRDDCWEVTMKPHEIVSVSVTR